MDLISLLSLKDGHLTQLRYLIRIIEALVEDRIKSLPLIRELDRVFIKHEKVNELRRAYRLD